MTNRDDRARRVRVVPKGPILVDGPVEVECPDGSVVRCDRFKVAICACGLSATAPLCDASHRRRLTPAGARREREHH
ncbi:CDGSH iron-sulfur domain-containing protein [Gordonia sp. PDNC005]|uniref:CDGSH iron-sulfur domain-containing protein n=1 Tax=unclassified Gordonia (in: high G+C Gram-positive bacteria) TaxID=2657482 RepID=UPI001962E379|nr:CDGSH iron-sulfur domain-containing protein [Gordonia sp. PDNC005]QRY61295.1 CDGSH iron-sulfur domain-containing protein [Gordonia sp. PDNC005]